METAGRGSANASDHAAPFSWQQSHGNSVGVGDGELVIWRCAAHRFEQTKNRYVSDC
jgi:hypothetical protein